MRGEFGQKARQIVGDMTAPSTVREVVYEMLRELLESQARMREMFE